MGGLLGALGAVVAIVWAFRIEVNTAKTVETLARIEKLLEKKEGIKK